TQGATTFDNTVNIGQLITQAATLDNNVTTAGGQAYSGAVTLGGNVTVSSGGTLDFLSTLAGNGDNITFVDDTAPTFGSTVSSIGTATLAPFTTTDSIGVGDSSKQALVGTVKYDFISTGGLFKLEGSAGTIAIGVGSDSGTITATALTLTPGLALTNGGAGGIAVSGALGAGSLLAQSGSSGIALDGGTITTTGGQIYSGSITLGGDTLLEATASTATVTFGQSENYNSANSLAVLVGGGLTINNSIQNSGSGALSLVAGWDGTAPTSASNVSNLISGTHYGSTGGNVVIGNGSQTITVAVGSAGGATTVLGDNITLNGSSVTSNYLIGPSTGAQIGFNYTAGQTAAATGSITVGALGNVVLQGSSSFAQIGHGGAGGASSNSAFSLTATGDIVVNAAAITLAGGNGGGYAQIGHGGQNFGYGDNELFAGTIS
ncbi:MAG: beta strand repeat-containing protein, partial [Stellaceae bacterium]